LPHFQKLHEKQPGQKELFFISPSIRTGGGDDILGSAQDVCPLVGGPGLRHHGLGKAKKLQIIDMIGHSGDGESGGPERDDQDTGGRPDHGETVGFPRLAEPKLAWRQGKLVSTVPTNDLSFKDDSHFEADVDIPHGLRFLQIVIHAGANRVSFVELDLIPVKVRRNRNGRIRIYNGTC